MSSGSGMDSGVMNKRAQTWQRGEKEEDEETKAEDEDKSR